ncbi:hypothetical protein [Microbacterium sp. P05]|uniref:hypothetical protein n=1 Tax=Microbacterium sp. P05 TaxID=3366948 RepID=UPI0037474A35
MKRRVIAILTMGMLLALTACTGLPTSGPVNPGLGPDQNSDARPYNFVPDPPPSGASPEQIVSGFLGAGSGPQDDWARARLYLTPDFAEEWDPLAGVTIDRSADRSAPTSAASASPTPDPASTVVVTQRVTAQAFVSATGEYTPADGNATPLEFRLVQSDGQWRIEDARDGIVLSQDVFDTVYQPANVMFFDPTWRYLVPDVRWFPRPLIATRVTQALIDGSPSEWLTGAVVNAFPENVSLVGNAVPLSGSAAEVELSTTAFDLEQVTLDRMQTQLEESLASIDVTSVELTVGTTPLDAERTAAVSNPSVYRLPLVELADGQVGFLGADSVERIPGLSDALEDSRAVSIAVDPAWSSAAVLTDTGAVVRARSNGTIEALDVTTPSLLPPSIDRDGAVWTAARDDPDTFTVYPAGGEPVVITAPWASATTLLSFQISREGSRIAALVTANGRTELWVAGIQREDDRPSGVGDPELVTTSSSTGIAVAWLNDVDLGALVTSGDAVALLRQPIGGRGTSTALASNVVDIAGGNSTVRLRTAEGALLIERGATWEESAKGISLLAIQQGQPQ